MKISAILKMAEIYHSAAIKLAREYPSGGFIFYCPDDQTVLLIKRSEEMSNPGTWDIPGGSHANQDPSALGTANREALEEITTLPEQKKLLGKHAIMTPNGNEYVIFVYAISKQEKEKWQPKIKLNQESEQFAWFPYDKLPKDTHLDLEWIPEFVINQ